MESADMLYSISIVNIFPIFHIDKKSHNALLLDGWCIALVIFLLSGFAAGTYYSTTGGGLNYQCLPLDPEYNRFNAATPISSLISGVEYQNHAVGILPGNTHDQNVPCARCFSGRTAVMMIPAKRTCPQGWTKEYEGMYTFDTLSTVNENCFGHFDNPLLPHYQDFLVTIQNHILITYLKRRKYFHSPPSWVM